VALTWRMGGCVAQPLIRALSDARALQAGRCLVAQSFPMTKAAPTAAQAASASITKSLNRAWRSGTKIWASSIAPAKITKATKFKAGRAG